MSEISIRERILDAGEKRARIGGYHGFSFRDLANDVGIKSSSIHYHFPTKVDLVEAIAMRYTEKAMAHLSEPSSAKDAFEKVVAMFRDALEVSDMMCLCGLLGAEKDILPERVIQKTGLYFEMLNTYLANALTGHDKIRRAQTIVASLEGALIVARNIQDPSIFDAIVKDLEAKAH